MQKPRITSVLATLVVVASAVTVASQGALALKNLTGEWSCHCSGGKGTCKVIQDSDSMSCFKGEGATCTGKCEFTSSTTGVHGGAVIQKQRPTLQQAPKVQPKVLPKGNIQRAE